MGPFAATIAVAAAITISASAASADQFVSASSPYVLWAGRPAVNATDGAVAFDWEGTAASLVVTGVGSSVTLWTNVTLAPGFAGRISVFVNDYDAANMMISASQPSYLLAAALPNAVNNVTVHYAFEPGSSGAARNARRTVAFFGFSAGDGGSFAPPVPLQRRIDIIGDSITAGSGYDKLESVGGALSLGTGCHPWAPVVRRRRLWRGVGSRPA